MHSTITTKQRVLEARGHQVPVDYFLYSCLERERLEKATMGDSQPHIAWPLLPKVGETEPVAAIAAAALPSLIRSLMTWYKDTFAELTEDHVVDHEQLLKLAPAVVGLCRDIARLHGEKTGGPLPSFDRKRRPAEVWEQLEAGLTEFFPNLAKLVLRYLQWSHAAEETEVFEPGSRPPVGRFAPPPLPRTMGSGGRPERSFGRPERSPRPADSAAREAAPHDHDLNLDLAAREAAPDEAEPREAASPRETQPRDSAPRGPRPPRPAGDGPGSREPRPRREGSARPRQSHPEGEEHTARMTKVALDEVDQAIANLAADQALGDVTLKPANSFYRRLQHQKIVDAGFHSNSIGDGADRAVQISRKDS